MQESFMNSFRELYTDLVDVTPFILMSLLVFIIGLVFIKSVKRIIIRRILTKAKDPVGARFVADIVVFIFYIILIFIVFRTLGLSALTQTIIGAAGLTTFIIGFALKDIGENFLAGIVMIFDRPFEMGDLVEIDGQVGRVIRISIRETTLKTVDGKDVYIPNSDIIKKHFINYTIDDQLRESFEITINNNNDIKQVMKMLTLSLNAVPNLLKNKKPSVSIKNFDNGHVQLVITYWYSLLGSQARNSKLKNDVMLKVIEQLKENNIEMPNHVMDVNLTKD
ncbi:mechanosensitive ion channel family protein [Belliella sp. R4-6]|uniref:Mechanosensitive ion channel family protein n=1 Tax=Belliella alkalica TaxID=1730871 RepID=A0ABS9VBY5_9BACT|nr:mechanosensitive ion channel domain-containing protein [Belliella alkalica]MCH7413936.1 mechanosensitive ion channel family protein [Belliella alkalica]